MEQFKVAETFLSINGEGTHAGQLAFFIRFAGCNLGCSYCDTQWANQADTPFTPMDLQEILTLADNSGSRCITITGGEPMLQPGIGRLLEALTQDPTRYVEVETNGSIPLAPYLKSDRRASFTMDYKLSASGMEKQMCLENLRLLSHQDTVKFVCGSRNDLLRAREIIGQYDLTARCSVYLSPVFGMIQPAEMVEFMKEHRMNGVTLQLQMHKVIWDPQKRGV